MKLWPLLFQTLYLLKCRIDPTKGGSELCKASSICSLSITVEQINNSSYTSLMYEVRQIIFYPLFCKGDSICFRWVSFINRCVHWGKPLILWHDKLKRFGKCRDRSIRDLSKACEFQRAFSPLGSGRSVGLGHLWSSRWSHWYGKRWKTDVDRGSHASGGRPLGATQSQTLQVHFTLRDAFFRCRPAWYVVNSFQVLLKMSFAAFYTVIWKSRKNLIFYRVFIEYTATGAIRTRTSL